MNPIKAEENTTGSTKKPGIVKLWAISGDVRVNPENGKVYEEQIKGAIEPGYRTKNWIWDGKTARLDAGRNEAVEFQLVIEGTGVTNVKVTVSELKGPGGAVITTSDIDLFREWYVWLPKSGVINPSIRTNTVNKIVRLSFGDGWMPDALIPLDSPKFGNGFSIPSTDFKTPAGAHPKQVNQAVWVDVICTYGCQARSL